MKKALLILFFVNCFFAIGQKGWNSKNISLLGGTSYYSSDQLTYSFELTYDNEFGNCLKRRPYHGASFIANFNGNFQEYGLRLFGNPTRWDLKFTRRLDLEPYLFVQVNYKSFNVKESELEQNAYNFQSGLGLFLNYHYSSKLTFRSGLSSAYTLYEESNVDPLKWNTQIRIGLAWSILNRKRTGPPVKAIIVPKF